VSFSEWLTLNMQTTRERLARFEVVFAILLIGSCGYLAHGVLINQLGYYKEDWYVIWSGLTQGAKSLVPMFQRDRPIVGYLYAMIYPLLGESTFSWQVYALVIRLLGAYALFWLLRILWSKQRFATTMIAILFVVYPGFVQQPQANTYQFHLTPLGLAIFSIALTIYAYQTNKILLRAPVLIVSTILAVLYPLILEYYIGMEGLRILLVWYTLRRESVREWWQDIRRLVLRLSPYLMSTAAFLYWRLFIFKSTRPTTNVDRLYTDYLVGSWHMVYRLVIELCRDFVETVWLAWSVPLDRELYWGSYHDLLIGVFMALVAMGLILVYYFALKTDQVDYRNKSQITNAMIWIGVLAVVIALIPHLIANRDVRFDLFNRLDRYTLTASVGTVILVYGLLSKMAYKRAGLVILVLLTGFSVLTHYNYSLYMRDFWDVQRQVWWQLSWRAPMVEDRTVLFVHLPPEFGYGEGYEIWPAADMIYYHQPGPPPVTAEVLNRETIYQIYQGVKKTKTHRNIWLNNVFSHPLIMSITQIGSCLNVIDGAKYELPTEEDPLVRLVAPYSKISRIQTGGYFKQPSSLIFGAEPEHTWCYYYEKAMYARQVGDWAGIARLGDEARARGYSAGDASEWMVFLEGYASVGRDKEAKQLAASIRSDENMQYSVCQQLSTPPDYPQGYAYAKVYELLCSPGSN
jgi:hypothetical protein